jgi:hypothetical protein
MEAHNPLGGFSLVGIESQIVLHVDAADDQDPTVQLDLPYGFRPEPTLSRRNPARFQRAPEGSRESPGCSSHNVV